MGRNILGSSDTGELKGGLTGEIEIIERIDVTLGEISDVSS